MSTKQPYNTKHNLVLAVTDQLSIASRHDLVNTLFALEYYEADSSRYDAFNFTVSLTGVTIREIDSVLTDLEQKGKLHYSDETGFVAQSPYDITDDTQTVLNTLEEHLSGTQPHTLALDILGVHASELATVEDTNAAQLV